MGRLKGSSLLEAIVAAVIFLLVFAAAMELMPRMAVRGDDALLMAEADCRVTEAFRKYATGAWPCGVYEESYDWGGVTVRIEPCGGFPDVQSVEATARIEGSGKRIGVRQLVECAE